MNLEVEKLITILKDYKNSLKSLDGSKLESFNLEGALEEIENIIFDLEIIDFEN